MTIKEYRPISGGGHARSQCLCKHVLTTLRTMGTHAVAIQPRRIMYCRNLHGIQRVMFVQCPRVCKNDNYRTHGSNGFGMSENDTEKCRRFCSHRTNSICMGMSLCFLVVHNSSVLFFIAWTWYDATHYSTQRIC